MCKSCMIILCDRSCYGIRWTVAIAIERIEGDACRVNVVGWCLLGNHRDMWCKCHAAVHAWDVHPEQILVGDSNWL